MNNLDASLKSSGLQGVWARLNAMATAAMVCLALHSPIAQAGPGAHGPNGEHLDAPVAAGLGLQRPRVTAQSEWLELVAELHRGELSIIIDRFESNEPLLDARVEVESAGIKALATFHADHGDYAVDDQKLLELLQKPGEHALVFTVVAGQNSDLLDGILLNAAPFSGGPDDHAPAWMIVMGGAALLSLGLGGFVLWRRARSRSRIRPLQGGSGVVGIALLTLSCVGVGTLAVWPADVQAGPGAHGPNGEHLDAPAAAPTGSALARLPDGSVNVPKIAQRRMAIRTAPVLVSEAAATTELPGRVIVDPNAGGRVQTLHGGRLEAGPRGLPVAGQRVAKGEVLAYVRHHAEPFAVGVQQAQLADLVAQRKLAEQRLTRLESLEGTVPRKDIDTAREEAAGLREREARIAQSLVVREALSAPVDGVVARVDGVLGQVLDARELVLEVVDPRRLLVEATTADTNLPTVVSSATLQGIAGVQLNLIGAAKVLRDGVLPLTFAARPDAGASTLPLAVGQPVTVLAQSRQRIRGMVLPAQAVVRSPANEPIVWIKSGPERFIPQPVQFRFLDASTVVVTQGLAAENRVVVQGAPLIAQIR